MKSAMQLGMTKNDLKKELFALEGRLAENFSTKKDLAALEGRFVEIFSTKKDLAALEGRFVEIFSTKKDLAALEGRFVEIFSTKKDLLALEARLDLKFATKDELKNELRTLENRLEHRFERFERKMAENLEESKSFSGVQFEHLKHMMETVIEGFSSHADRFQNHEVRISRAENDVDFIKTALNLKRK